VLASVFSFLAQFWRQLLFWSVLDAEQVGFVRRLGVPNRTVSPGLVWKWPILESLESEDARDYSMVCDPQSLRTKDGIDVVLRTAVTFNVTDARKYLLNVCDGRANVQDLVSGELGWLVPRRSAKEVLGGTVMAELERRACKKAAKWGLHVSDVKFLDSVAAPSFRLWNNQINSSGQE
jgi:regulator of protease activity HflC (stomatin/prohibitin superfamily)